MGYYTDYVINAKDVYNPSVMDFISSFLKDAWGEFYSDENTWHMEETKWYNHEKDMLKLSKQPEVKDVLFKVDGDGEEKEDIWVKYFKNGKMVEYRPEVIWPKFSEDDLK